MTKRVRRPSAQGMLLWLLAALLIGALAACTRATDAGIPSARESQATSSGEANSAQVETTPAAKDPQDAALAYSRCMREHGVSNFPDADAEGRILIPLGSIDPDAAVFREAGDACRDLAPEGWGDTQEDPGDAEVMLKFTRCMRENGVADFPDPDPKAGLQVQFGPVDPNAPKVKAALEICQANLQDLQRKPAIGG
ncbi:hypothetical protein BH10CHL1_BH10CHL1_28620 [soil metagenome]